MNRSARPLAFVLVAIAALAALVWWLTRDPSGAPGTAPARPDETTDAAAHVPAAPAAGDADALRTTPADVDRAASPQRDEPAPTELWGRVVAAADKAPIPGADVRLLHRDADGFWNLDLEYGARIDELGRTASDTDGRFRFDVARARAHRLEVFASGYAARTVVDCTGGSEVVVELCRGATIEGTVRSGGAPLVDVPIRIAVAGESVELAAGRSGIDGTFRFTYLHPHTVYVQVRSPHHGEEWQRIQLEEGGLHRVDIDVPVGRELTGSVHDAESGIPIAGAELSDSWTFQRTARTAADGTFVLRGFGDDDLPELYVRAEGYATATRSVRDRGAPPLRIELVQGGEVSGRILGPEGAPVGDAYVAAGASFMMTPGYEHTDWRRARVTGDGLFVVRGLRPDQLYWLFFRAPGRGTRTYALPKSLGSGERLDVGDVVLRPGGGVEGRVVDEHGAPLAGLSVSISGTNHDALAWRAGKSPTSRVSQFDSRSVDTDAHGRFRFTDLAAGAFHVSARVRGRPNAVTRKVRTRDGEIVEGIELVIPLGGVIAGTIRYADGRALGDAAGDLWLSSSRGGNAQIGPDGRFRFTGLDEGEHDISMLSAPEGFALTPRHGVTTGTEDLELVLAPAAKLAGTVVDADGRGVPARVYIRWAETAGRGAAIHTTDGEGRFAIDVPPGFRGSVHAMLPDSPMVQASVEDVTAGRSDLVLRIGR